MILHSQFPNENKMKPCRRIVRIKGLTNTVLGYLKQKPSVFILLGRTITTRPCPTVPPQTSNQIFWYKMHTPACLLCSVHLCRGKCMDVRRDSILFHLFHQICCLPDISSASPTTWKKVMTQYFRLCNTLIRDLINYFRL